MQKAPVATWSLLGNLPSPNGSQFRELIFHFPAVVSTHDKGVRGNKSVELGDETMHQFSVGGVVTCSVRYSAPGDYKILAFMPDRDGDHMYKIKSPLEEYERVVKESALARSDGLLPDEGPEPRRIGRRTITLPSLVPSVQPHHAETWDLEIV